MVQPQACNLKYKKGANTPSSQIEFQFKTGDLNFRSMAYDWLVIAGAGALFKGLGTINRARGVLFFYWRPAMGR